MHYFAPADLPRVPKNVVFVIDISGSMSGHKMEQVRKYGTSTECPQGYCFKTSRFYFLELFPVHLHSLRQKKLCWPSWVTWMKMTTSDWFCLMMKLNHGGHLWPRLRKTMWQQQRNLSKLLRTEAVSWSHVVMEQSPHILFAICKSVCTKYF